MTQLRKLMLEEIQRRNFTESTTRTYLRIIEDFARHFHRPPDQLGPELGQSNCGSFAIFLCQDVEAALGRGGKRPTRRRECVCPHGQA